jgi:peptidoglycan/LPS O-acetylase OafA/YrhL
MTPTAVSETPATSAPTLSSTQYFPALTGLRAVSACMVFFFHVSLGFKSEEYPFLLRWLVRFAQEANIGVNIFFVLSGFLITMRYAKGVELSGAWIRRYLQNRFARIYPIYFLLTILTFARMLVKTSGEWYQWPKTFLPVDKLVVIFLNLTLTRAFFEPLVYMGVPTAWTLTTEETFYLVAPLLLLGLRKSFSWFYYYPLILLAIGVLLVAFCSHFLPYYGLMANVPFMLIFTFFGRCTEFIVGMGLAFWLNRINSKSSAGSFRTGRTTLLGALAVLLSMPLLAIGGRLVGATNNNNVYFGFIVHALIISPAIAYFMLGLIKEQTWLQRLLQTKTADLLGKSSYVFYLIHLGAIDDAFSNHISSNWAVRLVVYTLLSIALYLWVEKPLHQRLRAAPQLRASTLAN